MKRLIWKELVEQRYIPLAYAMLLTVILIVWEVMGNWLATHGGGLNGRLTVNDCLSVLLLGFLIVGVFPGSNSIANETAQGTISFLSSIPIGRAKIWTSKILACAITMTASSACMAIVYCALTYLIFHKGLIANLQELLHSNGHLMLLYGGLVLCYVSAYALSIAVFCSVITDRPLAAAGLAIFIGVAFIGAVSACPPSTVMFAQLGLISAIPAFFLASWLAFRINGASSSLKRGMVGIGVLSVWFPVIVLGSAGTYHYFRNLAQLGVPQLTGLHISPQNWRTLPAHQFNRIDYTILYGRAKIGHIYTEPFNIGTSWRVIQQPSRVQSSSGDLTGKIVTYPADFRTKLADGTKQYIIGKQYCISYTYRPTSPSGGEVQVLSVLSASGSVVATVKIQAYKTYGYYPPETWFSDLHTSIP